MKTRKNIKFLSVLFLLGLMVSSCVKMDDFDIPEIIFEEPDIDVNFTIQQVKDLYTGGGPVNISGGPYYIEGYVVSNDEPGNFYKTLVVQDKPENPTAGISISTESTNMYTFYEPGRKIYMRVDGLYSGVFNGLPTLGAFDGSDNVARMSVIEFEERVFRSNMKEDIVPKVKTIGNLVPADLNTLIALEDVQVSDADVGEPYGNLDNTFGVNRIIINCERTESIVMRNSGFADFKNEIMPTGSGTLTAVMSWFGAAAQLLIRDTDDVDFSNPRCEEEEGEFDEIILNLPFSENFEGVTVGEDININGWRNVNVSGGSRKYDGREFSGNKYAQITAFNSNESPMEVWLVTPGLNLSGAANPVLNFETKDGFNNGAGLRVYVSTNLTDSTVGEASWTQLSASIATGTANGYANNFTPSGNVDLSAYAGQVVHIGFRYTGSSNGITTTYQVDNVTVTDGGGGGDPDPDPDPDPDTLLFENFESIATGPNVNISLPGWTNVNVTGGTRRYEGREFSSNKYAQVTAFNSDESPMEAWLVTPAVSLNGAPNPKLTFLTKDGFNNGNGLKVYVSTNFSGDPSSASWTELSATIASGTASGYAPNFTPSGTIDLSAYTGQTIHVGFEYSGADDGITTTYQIDDVHIFNE
jgi:hypothetical protein